MVIMISIRTLTMIMIKPGKKDDNIIMGMTIMIKVMAIKK